MESKDKDTKTDLVQAENEDINGTLLRALIQSVEEFIVKRKIEHLSESLKQIFLNRLKIFNKNVSNKLNYIRK